MAGAGDSDGGGGGAGDGGGAGREEAETRVRGDDVHGDAEGLRVLRGDTSDDEVAGEAESGRGSRRHCIRRRPDPVVPNPVSVRSFS